MDIPPLKYITPEQKDTSTLCVLPYFFLELFLYPVWSSSLFLPTSLPDSVVAPQMLLAKMLGRYFHWRSRYRNKQALELFFWLPVSFMSSTLIHCKIWWGDSLCATHLFKKETFRNSQFLPNLVGFYRSCFALQWKLLQVFQRELKPKTEHWYCPVFTKSLHSLPIYPEVLFQSCFISEAMVLTVTKKLPFAREVKSSPYMRLLSRNGCWEKWGLGYLSHGEN